MMRPLPLGILLGLAMLASLLLGYQSVALTSLLKVGTSPALQHLLWEYRLPRMLIAPVCGAALALAGCLLQTTTRNPLVAPDVLGINAAASCCVVLVLACYPSLGLFWLNGLAFVAAVAMMLLLHGLLRQMTDRGSTVRLPLLGTVLAMLFAAITQTVITLDPATQDQALSWLAGNIAGRSLFQLAVASPWLLAGCAGCVWLARRLDLFYLGDAQVRALGYQVDRLRQVAMISASLLVAGVVSVVGPLGFIGLLVPLMVRRAGCRQHRQLLPLVALLGALLLTLADVLARFVLYPEDIPVGVVTALIGGPVFLFLLYRAPRGGQYVG